MAKLNLVILDRDSKYVSGVTNFFIANYSDKFTLISFTEKKYLLDFLEKEKRIDILLLSEDMYEQDFARESIKTIIILSDNSEQGEINGYPSMMKYQQAQNLYSDIINVYTTQNPDNIEKITNEYDKTKIITFYSPLGGIGKTTLAVATAITLAAQDIKVLYLNFEDIQTTNIFFNSSEGKNLSELIYYVKEKSSDFPQKFLSIKSRDEETKVDFINPTESILDVDELTSEDVEFFIESILNLNMYKYVIIDTSSKFNSIYKLLLSSSHKVIVPIGQDSISEIKTNIFINEFNAIKDFSFIVNRYNKDIETIIPDTLIRENKEIELAINFDSLLFSQQASSKNLLNNGTISKATASIINMLP